MYPIPIAIFINSLNNTQYQYQFFITPQYYPIPIPHPIVLLMSGVQQPDCAMVLYESCDGASPSSNKDRIR